MQVASSASVWETLWVSRCLSHLGALLRKATSAILSARAEFAVNRAAAAHRRIRFHSNANIRTAIPTTMPINRALLAFSVIKWDHPGTIAFE
jgi:hypothetical protein